MCYPGASQQMKVRAFIPSGVGSFFCSCWKLEVFAGSCFPRMFLVVVLVDGGAAASLVLGELRVGGRQEGTSERANQWRLKGVSI